MYTNRRTAYLGCCITVLVIIGIVWIRSQEPSSIALQYVHNGQVNFDEAESYWKLLIQKKGPTAAQKQMTQEGGQLNESQRHLLAHSFGGALFKEEGLPGLPTCGDSFIYGCYHQFLGEAIAQLGIEAAIALGDACARETSGTPFACKHGIGHGLLGYFGYDPVSLVQSLSLCDRINPGDVSSGCVDGVFMEFNIHELTALDTDVVVPRPLTSNWYQVCDDVAAKYVFACVFELPNWWVAALDAPMPTASRFQKAGEACVRMNESLSGKCFEGLGYIAPIAAEFSADKIREFCTSGADGAEARLLCFSAAAQRTTVATGRDRAGLCKDYGLLGPALRYCTDYKLARGEQLIVLPENL